MRKEDVRSPSPRPSPGPAAAEPGTCLDAGRDCTAVPRGGLDTRYEQLRHAALHARAEAFPLGFAVLTRRGVIGWRRALPDPHPTPASTAPVVGPGATSPASPAVAVPAAVAAELVDALAAVVLAGA